MQPDADELIESIYQAAYRPELWREVMRDMAGLLDAATATMLHGNAGSPDGPFTDALFGSTPRQIASYAAYFRTVDVRFHHIKKLPRGGVLADGHNYDFEQFTKTEIYEDFWKPARLGRGLAGLVSKGEATTSVVSVRREIGHHPFTISEIHTFQLLLPHIRRSLHFQGQLLRADIRANGMAFALDCFPVAVFLLDRHSTVLDHNRAARQLLADAHSPLRIRQQRLTAYRPADDRKLQDSVRAAAQSLHQIETLPRFLRLPLRDGQRIVTFLPVPITGPLAMPSDCVLLFCQAMATSFVDPQRVQQQFGFTPAESLLAAAIAEGVTVERFANERGISVETARAQLKSAMQKAGVHTQAQLAGTILRSLTALVRVD